MRRNAILLALALLATGCHSLMQHGLATNDPLPVAHQLQVGQLVFHSDFDLPRNHRLVQELVAERDDVYRTVGLPASDESIDVYLFHDQETYRKYLVRHFPSLPSRRAFFLQTDTRLAVYAHWSDRVGEDLRHEAAHGYLHAVVPGIPLWLDEGLAEFFEVPRGQDGLNRPHLDLLSDMMRHENWQPNLVRLERLRDAAQMQQLDYAESWAWVYYLLHSEPQTRELLTGYLAELRTHGDAGPLSQRLANVRTEPAKSLGDYLAGLNRGTNIR